MNIKAILVIVVLVGIGVMIGSFSVVNINKGIRDNLTTNLDKAQNQYNVCLNTKTTLETTKNSLNQQITAKDNSIRTLQQQFDDYKTNHSIKENMPNITESMCKNTYKLEKKNNTYILGLIRQIKRCEDNNYDCSDYNQTDEEEELKESLDECEDTLKEIEELI